MVERELTYWGLVNPDDWEAPNGRQPSRREAWGWRRDVNYLRRHLNAFEFEELLVEWIEWGSPAWWKVRQIAAELRSC